VKGDDESDMEPTTLDEILRRCLRTEEAHKYENVPGDPVIHAIGVKPKNSNARWAEVHPGLTGSVILSGHENTPTVVLLKCKDIRKYFSRQNRKDRILDIADHIIERFKKRT